MVPFPGRVYVESRAGAGGTRHVRQIFKKKTPALPSAAKIID